MRRLSVLVVFTSVVATLTACTGGATCDPSVPSGNSSSIVDAEGGFGTAPEVSFPSPLVTGKPQRSVLIHGDGQPVRQGQPVVLEATILNGADGSVLQQTAYENGGTLFSVGDDAIPALGDGLLCAAVGSRIAVVASGEDAGAPEGGENALVFVVDVVDAFPSRARGVDQVAVSGLPSVVSAPDGRPGITIPNETAPSEVSVATLILGDGEELADDARAIVKFTSVDWGTKNVLDSSWESGGATVFDLGSEEVPPDLRDALVGKPIGSRVLAVIPDEAAADAGAELSAAVWVVDILGSVE